MAVLTGRASRIDVGAGHSTRVPAFLTGVIGAAVIRAARRSAGLTRHRLARMLAISPVTVRAWENGNMPLFCVDYGQICQLAEAFRGSGAQVGAESADLVLASQCDLLLTGILHGFEDYAEVPPIDEDGPVGEAARGLLRWALAGQIPERYRHYASPGPLLAKADVAFVASMARELQEGSHGYGLAGYGAALAAFAEQ